MSQLTCFRKLGLAIAALLLLGVASTAKADTVFIVGNTNGSLATATVTCTLVGNTLTLTVFNTSPFDARITGFGFDIGAGNIDGFTGSVVTQPAGVAFVFSDGDFGNVNQFNDAVLDFGFLTGSNFSGGDPQDGLPPGIDPGDEATFTVTGDFGGLTEEEICHSIFVRFQRVGANGQLSDVGTPGNGDTPVPEPTSMLLLGMGLSGVAAAVRRRNRKKT